jgi:hypothetical protein
MRARAFVIRAVAALAPAGAAIVLLPPVLEAILVAPHAIFIDHRTRSGQMFLVNTGTVPEEVVIDLRFGYPDSDSAGGVFVRFIDNPDSTVPAATPWLRAFPRRTVVNPGERQAVRLLASPPANLPDGEYWSRLIVTSREIRPPLAGGDSVVRAGVNVELRTILSVTYRKGAPRTSVTMTEFQPSLTRDTAVVWLSLVRDGNAAFLGSVTIEVLQAGRVIGEFASPIAVFYNVRRRFAIPLETPAAPGRYTVRLRVSTAREDLDRANILPAPPIADSALVELRP